MQPYYQMGEALRLEGNAPEALYYYSKSFHVQQDAGALSKIILLNGK